MKTKEETIERIKSNIITQLRFHTISGMTEATCIENIMHFIEKELESLNPYKIDEERFMKIYQRKDVYGLHQTVQEYNSTLPEVKELEPLPSEMPEELWNINRSSLWKKLISKYGTPKREELPSVDEAEPTIHPEPVKAGDKRVLVNGSPLKVDFRVVAEEYYQKHFTEREWWMDLKEGDKFMYVGDVKDFFHFSLSCKNGMDYPVRNCTPYIEPVMTADDVIKAHNLSEQEVKAIREGKA